MLVMTWVNNVFFGHGLEVNVFNTGIHFISRRTHVTANRFIQANSINIIFDIIRFKEFFSAGVLFEIGTLVGW